MRASAYLLTMAGTMALLAVAAVVLAILVDPYRMFGTPAVPGLTELKPRAIERTGIAKTYQLERIAPKTLLLGNSRTEIGIDPESRWFPDNRRAVFNAAYAGGGICLSLMMLRNAIAVRAPESIILGVDFQDVLTVAKASTEPAEMLPTEPDETERRLLVDRSGHPNPERGAQIWRDRGAATLTIDALLDSLRTLLNQDPARSATLTELGFNPLREYRDIVERNGYHGLFSAKDAEYRKRYALYTKPDFGHPSPTMALWDRCLLALMTLAVEHRIAVTLYIHPYHANFLDMLGHFNLWQSFEDWKRHLVALVAAFESDAEAIRIIDFSGYNEFTTEAVPASGDTRSEMRWYWEPGHYKSALGEHILGHIYGGRTHFGRVLTTATIDRALAEIREERDRFARHSVARGTER